jgi:hypothetical protein
MTGQSGSPLRTKCTTTGNRANLRQGCGRYGGLGRSITRRFDGSGVSRGPKGAGPGIGRGAAAPGFPGPDGAPPDPRMPASICSPRGLGPGPAPAVEHLPRPRSASGEWGRGLGAGRGGAHLSPRKAIKARRATITTAAATRQQDLQRSKPREVFRQRSSPKGVFRHRYALNTQPEALKSCNSWGLPKRPGTSNHAEIPNGQLKSSAGFWLVPKCLPALRGFAARQSNHGNYTAAANGLQLPSGSALSVGAEAISHASGARGGTPLAL